MERTNRHYTSKYFQELGFSRSEARALAGNWNRQTPQTMEEVRRGILWERNARESNIKSWMEAQPIERK